MLVKEETRKLARIVRVDAVKPIPKADRLEVAVVGGWECVVQKDTFKTGDLGLYFEIDAAIALDNPVFKDFDTQYLKKTVDEPTGKEYAVIRTIRLRGQLSQGLLLPAKYFPGSILGKFDEGWNVTEALEVLKYVTPAEAKLFYQASESISPDASASKKFVWWLRAKLVKGIIADGLLPWPHGHVKSEEERVQNIPQFYQQMLSDDADVEATIKFDGESATFYTDLATGDPGAAQRNFALRTEDVPYTWKQSLRVYAADWLRFLARRFAGAACPFPTWKRAYVAQSVPLVAYFKRARIGEKLKILNHMQPFDFLKDRVVAVQGEMVGPGFNNNAEGFKAVDFYVYRAYVNGNIRLTPQQTRAVAAALGLNYMPIVADSMKLPSDMKDLLKFADGPSVNDKNKPREGVVIKNHANGASFKVISNKWLEKKEK